MSDAVTTRKREALELFAPLPRHYDSGRDRAELRPGSALAAGNGRRRRGPAADDRVLDVATGTGLVAAELVGRYGCDIVGLDQSAQMLAGARQRLERDPGLAKHVTLMAGEAERLPFSDGEFDHLTFTYLLRYVDDPAAAMRELARVVRPGGRIASLEFAVPDAPLWRALWQAYTRVGLPALGRLVSREWAETGRFLARSIPDFYGRHPVAQVVEMWSAPASRTSRCGR